jgi:primosomal protein N' (replication factor Y) (superfamily II helicase)
MARIARVVPEVSLDRVFDYAITGELDAQVTIGAKVKVEFKSRKIVGYVVEISGEASDFKGKLKPILELLGPKSFLPPSLIQLAQWMAQYYCAPLTVALLSVLPKAVRRADAAFKQRLWVEPLTASLPEEAVVALKKARAQMSAWEHIQKNGAGWLADLTEVFGAPVWRGLAERNLVSIEARTQDRDPFLHTPVAESTPHAANPEQVAALKVIGEEISAAKPRVVLLHGVTGSGKTEVYLQAIAQVLAQGKSALILVPEIALTPQTVEHFRARFVGQKVGVAVLHSHLSSGERHDQWQHIRAGRARIVIGARSAVFAPLDDLGIIVVDEEHEHSYKQEESPHYHARDVAVMRGHLERVAVVLGSATPSLESYHHAKVTEKYRLVELLQRVEEGQMPTTHILDIRSTKKGEQPALLAPRLVEAIQARLDRHEQTIIFLNRRGYSSSLQCPQCGHVEMCPNCSVALTFHRRAEKLRCHMCDFSGPVPHACPHCGFAPFKYAGSGTEKVEHALADAFPNARIERMDADSMRGKDAYARTLADFAEGRIEILVGTQMIAKGLHFPRVTCVGVINADLALQIPDFRASERVFQLLMQVSGRSGRGQVRGEVFVQTRVPFHPAIQFARHHDYMGFVEQELEFRRSLHYPPYERFILVTLRGRSEEKTLFVAENLAKEMERLNLPETEITGPSPAPIARIEERYRFQIFLRTRRITGVTPSLRPLFMDRAWPDDIRVTLDVDPVDLL